MEDNANIKDSVSNEKRPETGEKADEPDAVCTKDESSVAEHGGIVREAVKNSVEPEAAQAKDESAAAMSNKATSETPEEGNVQHKAEDAHVNEEPTSKETSEKAEDAKKEKAPSPVGKHAGHKKCYWQEALIVLLAFVVCYCGAYLGSRRAVKHEMQEYQKEIAKDFDDDMPWEIFGDVPSDPGDGSESVQNTRPAESKAILGIVVQQTDSGLRVVQISDDSKAGDAGLKVGDVITEVDGEEAKTAEEMADIMSEKDAGDKVDLTVERDGKTVNITDVELVENTAAKGKKS